MAIATATAIALAAAAASAGATAYGAHAASSASEHAADTQANAQNRATTAQTQSNRDAMRFQQQQAEAAWRASEADRRANFNQSRTRADAARSLGQSIGFNLPASPDYVPSEDPHLDVFQESPDPNIAVREGYTLPGQNPQPQSTTQRTSSASGGPDALGALLKSGLSPQDAAAQFNKQYGRTTGNEAVYYANNGTIGLPEGYFSNGQTGWNFAARGNGGSSTRSTGQTPYQTGTLGSTLAPPMNLAPPQDTQAPPELAPFYRPGTLGFSLGARRS